MGSPRDVRLSSNSGGIADIPALRVCANNNRLMQPQQKTVFYSITSSARASSVGGTVRPSVLAAFRLKTS
jgi:hypothetical protein